MCVCVYFCISSMAAPWSIETKHMLCGAMDLYFVLKPMSSHTTFSNKSHNLFEPLPRNRDNLHLQAAMEI